MGKFTDTKYVQTIDNLVDATKDKLVNPYYIFSDKKPTKVTYYAQNIEKSTLDEASGLYGAHIGKHSPFKFNKIKDFLLYGIDRISTEYDLGDSGIEANQIGGNAIVLPNTIIPRPGDFFSIDHVKETILFKVNGVTIDTLDNGSNIYSFEYNLELTDSINNIEKQIEKSFTFIATNVGTDFKTILQDSEFEVIANLESLIESLIVYFKNIFFDSRLQTFVFNHNGKYLYDAFLIEFLIRNKVLDFGDEYVFVSHAAYTGKTFSMDYTKTFFNSLENPNTMELNTSCVGTADQITDPNSLFSARKDPYYMIKYHDNTPYKTRFNVFDMDVFEHIKSNTLYGKGDSREIYNLWIAYFNNDKDFINGDMLSLIKNADYMDNLEHFYVLAISIFILERYINILLS